MTAREDVVQAVKAALWVTEHYPVDENDVRLPSADHPDFVQMEVMSYPSAKAAVDAAWLLIAEDIARRIEARCLAEQHGWDEDRGRDELCTRCTLTARFAREVPNPSTQESS